LIVNPSVPAGTVGELVAYAKANPGKLNFASTGPGQTDHLAGELFNTLTGARMVHIPYKGGPAAIADLLAGNVQVMFATVSTALPHIRAGKVRPLAMTGNRRTTVLPDLPTIAEAGVPGYVVNNWYGIFAPVGTPAPIVARLNAEIVKALDQPEVRQRLLESGLEAAPSTPDAFAAYVKAESAKWAKVVKDSGAKVD